ncbi:MAG: hypothetical protein KC620_04305 [Myxococcales bacterium]|nr:hypothetical protein [Myxococcales bacterium]
MSSQAIPGGPPGVVGAQPTRLVPPACHALFLFFVGILGTSACVVETPTEEQPFVRDALPDAQNPPVDALVDARSDDVAVSDAAPDARPNDAEATPACANGQDDDNDGLVDAADPGCADSADDDEADPAVPAACANAVDDDADGLIDYPDDPDCVSAGGDSEGPVCGADRVVLELTDTGERLVRPSRDPATTVASCGAGAGAETIVPITLVERSRVTIEVVRTEPAIGALLHLRGVCRERRSEVACQAPEQVGPLVVALAAGTWFLFVQPAEVDGESAPVLVRVHAEPIETPCADEIDNDGDGLIDQADPGCSDALDPDETDPDPLPACGDGADNDGDGAIDWPDDPDCSAAGGISEGAVCAGIDRVVYAGAGHHELEFAFDSTDLGGTRGSCGGNGDEVAVVLLVDRPSSLTGRVRTAEAGAIAVHIRADCAERASEVFCDAAFTETRLLADRLEPGQYFIIVDHDVGFAERQDTATVELDLVALPPRACENGVDDDGDGMTDLADPGCDRGADDDETDPAHPPACANDVDDDDDGAIDWPADRQCPAAGGRAEATRCALAGPLIEVDEAGGEFVFDPPVFRPGFAHASCGGDLGGEVVFALTLTHPANVQVDLAGIAAFEGARIFARGECAERNTEVGCADGGPLVLRALEAGTWYVLVELGVARAASDPPVARFLVESLIQACNNELDDDGDGLIDAADPGCERGLDPSEVDPEVLPECADGLDNDEDGAIDWPADLDCRAAGDPEEARLCAEGVEVVDPDAAGAFAVHGDRASALGPLCIGARAAAETAVIVDVPAGGELTALVDQPAATVAFLTDCDDVAGAVVCGQFRVDHIFEAATRVTVVVASPGEAQARVLVDTRVRACNDGVDNDDDGLIDLADPGCAMGFDPDEADPPDVPECANGVDDDGDGAIDWPDDIDCQGAGQASESLVCVGAEILLAMPPEGGVFPSDTRGVQDHFGASCGGGGASGEVVYALPVLARSAVTLEIIEANYDTVMFLRDSCEANGRELACDDDGAGALRSRIATVLDPGVYFIFIDGFGAAAGTSRLSVVVEAVP